MAGLIATPASAAATRLISVRTDGGAADDNSSYATISNSGNLVAFESEADSLSGGDDNTHENIFVRNHRQGTTRLVSVRSDGGAADGSSERAEISGGGRFVCFESDADNLSDNDNNSVRNIFVHDRRKHTTRLVSRRTDGGAADGSSEDCSISDDGRFIAFESQADNLHLGDNNSAENIFVRDRATGRTRWVSRRTDGSAADSDSEEPVISGNGRYVAFDSEADNLSNADDDAHTNVFMHNLKTKKTQLVSRASGGDAGDGGSFDPAIGNGGRYIAFESDADNLSSTDDNNQLNIFVRDRKTGKTRLISRRSDGVGANGFSSNPGISGNGRYVIFQSDAGNLSENDDDSYEDVFVFDLATKKVRLVSRGTDGSATDDSSYLLEPSGHHAISDAGDYVAFSSYADNLSPSDDNSYENVFRRGGLT